MYIKINKFLKQKTKEHNPNYNKLSEQKKKEAENKMLEYLIASWISNENINDAKKYVIDETKSEITGIDVAFYDKKVLYLIQVKNTNKINSADYNKSKVTADAINKILSDPTKHLNEKQTSTGIDLKILTWLKNAKWIYKYKFIFVYNSSTEATIDKWPNPIETKENLMTITEFLKKIILEINNGFKMDTHVEHILNYKSEWGKNSIEYKDNNQNKGIIFPLNSIDLINIIKKEIESGNHLDSLFEGNVRFKVKKDSVNSVIKESLRKNEENFFLLNNGITIIVDSLKFNETRNIITFTNCNIINGQQTVRSLYELSLENINLKNINILTRIYKLEKKELKRVIPFATNNQNKIDIKDLLSLKDFQENIRENLIKNEIFYIYKKGKSKVNDTADLFEKSITFDKIIKLFAICYDKHVTVKNNMAKLFEEVYTNIGTGGTKPSNSFYNTETTILLLEMNDKETVNKMLKTVFIYFSLQKKEYRDIWNKNSKSFDIINYVFYMLLKYEKNEDITQFLNENFNEIWKILENYFEETLKQSNNKNDILQQQTPADFFRTKENWDGFCDKIEDICLSNEKLGPKVNEIEKYLISQTSKKMLATKEINDKSEKNDFNL